MRRRTAPTRAWEKGMKTAGGAPTLPRGSSVSIALTSRSVLGFDFMEDAPLSDRNRGGGGANAGRGDGAKNGQTAAIPARSSRQVPSLFDLLQEVSVPPETARCDPTVPGAPAAPAVALPLGSVLEKNDEVSRRPNPSSDRNAADTGLAEERKRKGQWGAGNVAGRLELPKPVGAVRGSVFFPSRISSVLLQGPGSADRSRRVTFVGTGPAPPEKESLLFRKVSSHASESPEQQRPAPRAARGGSDNIGSNFTSIRVENTSTGYRTSQRRSLGRVTPEPALRRERDSVEPTLSATPSEVKVATGAVEDVLREMRAEGSCHGQKSGNTNERAHRGEGSMPGRVLEMGSSLGGRGVRRRSKTSAGSGRAGPSDQETSPGGVGGAQGATRDSAENGVVRWMAQNDGDRHGGGQWMTQDESGNAGWVTQPEIDREACATHTGAASQRPMSQREQCLSQALTPDVKDRAARSPAEEKTAHAGPRDSRWITQSQKPTGKSGRWQPNAGVRGGQRMRQSQMSTAGPPNSESRKRTSCSSKEYHGDDLPSVGVRSHQNRGQKGEWAQREGEEDDHDLGGDQAWDRRLAAECKEGGDAAAGGESKELSRVRGLCRLRGTIVALVEWSNRCTETPRLRILRDVVDSTGEGFSEVSFMLASSLKHDWPQHYMAYLEAKLVFQSDEDARVDKDLGSKSGAPAGERGELVVWNAGNDQGEISSPG